MHSKIAGAMPIPAYNTFYRPLLELAADGQEHSFRDAIAHIGSVFGVTPEERDELIPSGSQRLLDNRVGWGRTYLAKAGLLDCPRRGVFKITARGQQALASGAAIDNKFLRQYPEFLGFMNPRVDSNEADTGTNPQTPAQDGDAVEATPEELIDKGYQRLRSALASEILERVLGCSPAFFERLVVQLLVAMGYGGSLSDAGKAIGKSGDNGIDGIIKEDKLGLDVIYVQAKRYKDTVVGRPDIQQFAGALQGQRARKGVFLTTSTFSAEARQYATQIDTRIVLIDGKELARLMIEHGVGVSTATTYEVKKIDFDYFVEDGA